MELVWKHLPDNGTRREAYVATDKETGMQKAFCVNFNPWKVVVPSELNHRTFSSENTMIEAVKHFYSKK